MTAKNPYQMPKEVSPLSAKSNKANEEALTVIVQRLVPALHPHKIIVFGSYIYGAPSPNSDLDLLVIVDTSARPVDCYLRVSSLLRPRPFPLDILVKTPEETK